MRLFVTVFVVISLQITFTSVSSKSLPQDVTPSSSSNPAGEDGVQSTDAPAPSVPSTDAPSESSGGSTDAPPSSSPNVDTSESSESNTVIPDVPSSEEPSPSPSTEPPPPPKKIPPKRKPYYGCFGLFDIGSDYDSFLDFVNQTSQKHLEILDRSLTALEKEIRPGTPLMKLVDWVLSLFNKNQKTPARGNSTNSQGEKKPSIKVTLPDVPETPET